MEFQQCDQVGSTKCYQYYKSQFKIVAELKYNRFCHKVRLLTKNLSVCCQCDKKARQHSLINHKLLNSRMKKMECEIPKRPLEHKVVLLLTQKSQERYINIRQKLNKGMTHLVRILA